MGEVIRIETDDCAVTLESARRLSEALGYEWAEGCEGAKELFFVDKDGKRAVQLQYDKLDYHNFAAGKADEWVREMAEESFRRLLVLPTEKLSLCSKRFGSYVFGLIREIWDLKQILSERTDSREPLLQLIEAQYAELDIVSRDHAAAQRRIDQLELELREKDDRIQQLIRERNFAQERRQADAELTGAMLGRSA